jgi:hypothetical protein
LLLGAALGHPKPKSPIAGSDQSERKLTPDNTLRRLISGDAAAVLREIFPRVVLVAGDEAACQLCADSCKQQQAIEAKEKKDKAELKKVLNNLYGEQV